mgnify:FL=1
MGKSKKPLHRWSKEDKECLLEISLGKSYKEIVEIMKEKFDYDFSIEQVRGAIQRYKLDTGLTGQFEKGNIPWNKGTKGLMKRNSGCFAKGHECPYARPLGSERVDTEGYTLVKVDKRNWKLKHRIIWEEHNGEIPADHYILFLDRNKQNFDINNLAMVSRREMLMINRYNLLKEDAEVSKSGVMLARLLSKIAELKREGKD